MTDTPGTTRFAGKVAAVTGGASGIGLATAPTMRYPDVLGILESAGG